MTPIQEITLEMNDRLIKVMIEKISSNEFTIQTATKIKNDGFYSPFSPIFSKNQVEKFKTAADALSAISGKFVNSIIGITNSRKKYVKKRVR